MSEREKEYMKKLDGSNSEGENEQEQSSDNEKDSEKEIKQGSIEKASEGDQGNQSEPIIVDEHKDIPKLIQQLSMQNEEKAKELDNLVDEKTQNMAIPFQYPTETYNASPDSPDGSTKATFKEPEKPKLEKQPTVDHSRQSSINSFKDPVSITY